MMLFYFYEVLYLIIITILELPAPKAPFAQLPVFAGGV